MDPTEQELISMLQQDGGEVVKWLATHRTFILHSLQGDPSAPARLMMTTVSPGGQIPDADLCKALEALVRSELPATKAAALQLAKTAWFNCGGPVFAIEPSLPPAAAGAAPLAAGLPAVQVPAPVRDHVAIDIHPEQAIARYIEVITRHLGGPDGVRVVTGRAHGQQAYDEVNALLDPMIRALWENKISPEDLDERLSYGKHLDASRRLAYAAVDSFRSAEGPVVQGIGATIGSGIGAAAGGPVGAAIGSLLGTIAVALPYAYRSPRVWAAMNLLIREMQLVSPSSSVQLPHDYPRLTSVAAAITGYGLPNWLTNGSNISINATLRDLPAQTSTAIAAGYAVLAPFTAALSGAMSASIKELANRRVSPRGLGIEWDKARPDVPLAFSKDLLLAMMHDLRPDGPFLQVRVARDAARLLANSFGSTFSSALERLDAALDRPGLKHDSGYLLTQIAIRGFVAPLVTGLGEPRLATGIAGLATSAALPVYGLGPNRGTQNAAPEDPRPVDLSAPQAAFGQPPPPSAPPLPPSPPVVLAPAPPAAVAPPVVPAPPAAVAPPVVPAPPAVVAAPVVPAPPAAVAAPVVPAPPAVVAAPVVPAPPAAPAPLAPAVILESMPGPGGGQPAPDATWPHPKPPPHPPAAPPRVPLRTPAKLGNPFPSSRGGPYNEPAATQTAYPVYPLPSPARPPPPKMPERDGPRP